MTDCGLWIDYGSAIIDYKLPTTDYTSQATPAQNPIRIPAIVSMYDGHVLGGGSSLGILSYPI